MMGIQEVHSSDQIDQLNALRFKTKSKNSNLPRPNSEKIFRKRNAGNAEWNSERRNVHQIWGALLAKSKSMRLETWGF